MLPELFIGGAAKSGTTTLHYWLNQHPEVFFPSWPQEIHYYDQDYFYNKGLVWFEKHFSRWKEQKILAQTCPGYLYYPHVPERIFKDRPDAKFIFILRDPVDRAYSEYWMNVMYGFETLSFEQAIAKENERISKSPKNELYYAYVKRGRYSEQLIRFFEVFPRENILTLLFEELKSDGHKVLGKCSDFLEIDRTFFKADGFRLKNYNPSRIPRIKSLQRVSWFFRKYLPLYGVYGPMKRLAIPSYLIDFLNLKIGNYPPMQEESRNEMLKVYSTEINVLERLLGRDLSNWVAGER